ncbi:hypothetical protein Vretimale_18248 [Volvox reticuliferus]|uniref:Pherophorin domain-containing protein n=1 Tax=Volvox reticuliferus TaxID=1737510 RepID=A0A8J4GUN5_9CHLO|nr:hypothetical protein Vretifemale_18018 [Volvox reticuliferus]GIM15468.1 hypothetical protein Vretimale_18248 [Volvox reticuliferus]
MLHVWRHPMRGRLALNKKPLANILLVTTFIILLPIFHLSPWTSAAAKDVRALEGAAVSTTLEDSVEDQQQVSFSYNPLLLSPPSPSPPSPSPPSPPPPPSPADDVTHTTLPTPFRSKHLSEVSFLATLSPRPPSPRPPALLLPPPRRLPSPYPPPIPASSNYPRPPSPQASLTHSPSPTTLPPPSQQNQILNNSSRISSPIEKVSPPMQSPSPPLRRPKDPPPSPSPTRSPPSQTKLSPPPPRPSPSPPPPRNDIMSPPPPPPTPCTVCVSIIGDQYDIERGFGGCTYTQNIISYSMGQVAQKTEMTDSFYQVAATCISTADLKEIIQVCFMFASKEKGSKQAGLVSVVINPLIFFMVLVPSKEMDGCSGSLNGHQISIIMGGEGPDPNMAPSCLQGSFDVQCLGNDGQIANTDNCNTDPRAAPFSTDRILNKFSNYSFNTDLYCFEIRTRLPLDNSTICSKIRVLRKAKILADNSKAAALKSIRIQSSRGEDMTALQPAWGAEGKNIFTVEPINWKLKEADGGRICMEIDNQVKLGSICNSAYPEVSKCWIYLFDSSNRCCPGFFSSDALTLFEVLTG